MLRNYLTVAMRHLLRHKAYSLINILGLAVGMACCMVISLQVWDEVRFDRFHTRSDRIHRVVRETWDQQGQHRFHAETSMPLAWDLGDALPEIEQVVRIWNVEPWGGTQVKYGEKKFDYGFCLADQNVLDVFDFPLVKGDRAQVLKQPASVLISEKMVEVYFAGEDPIGKVLVVEGRRFAGAYTVTGIFKDVPSYSSLQFDFLASNPASERFKALWYPPSRKDRHYVETYVLLRDGYDTEMLNAKLSDFAADYYDGAGQARLGYHLQPLTRIRLFSQYDYGLRRSGEYRGGGDATQVYLLAALAGCVLLIACINFMNLTTARAGNRAREVGVRKVVGAHRVQLMRQFLGESVVLTGLAFVLAVGLVVMFLPTFNEVVGKQLSLFEGDSVWGVLGLCVFAVFVAVLAGGYPAFYLSAFLPVDVLKGVFLGREKRVSLRKVLVVVQFGVTVFFIFGTLTIYKQLDYIENKDLGFTKQNLMTFNPFNKELKPRYRAVKQAFLEHPDILSAAASASVPPWMGGLRDIIPEGSQNTSMKMHVMYADEGFIDTYQIGLVMGRYFSADRPQDVKSAVVVNETAVRVLGWENPLGKTLQRAKRHYTVVGVVKDFHIRSLHQKLPPVAMFMEPNNWTGITLRYKTDDFSAMEDFVEKTFRAFRPDVERFGHWSPKWSHEYLYESEQRFSNMVATLSMISIFIACLGLLGLVSFSVEQRTQEIGIRKVLGASVPDILVLFGRRFVTLILIANVIALPFASYFSSQWLENFVYRTDIDFLLFVLSGGGALIIALATVCYHALRAAYANPVDALRYE